MQTTQFRSNQVRTTERQNLGNQPCNLFSSKIRPVRNQQVPRLSRGTQSFSKSLTAISILDPKRQIQPSSQSIPNTHFFGQFHPGILFVIRLHGLRFFEMGNSSTTRGSQGVPWTKAYSHENNQVHRRQAANCQSVLTRSLIRNLHHRVFQLTNKPLTEQKGKSLTDLVKRRIQANLPSQNPRRQTTTKANSRCYRF